MTSVLGWSRLTSKSDSLFESLKITKNIAAAGWKEGEREKMGDESATRKPSRSDEVLEAEQQTKITEQIRLFFDSVVPKRPKKPNRSEATVPEEDDASLYNPIDDGNIPELNKFQSLRSQSHAFSLLGEGGVFTQEDFVETDYYDKLNSIDKQHHTTGSGFIRVGVESSADSISGIEGQGRGGEVLTGLKSNPATNEWIPRMDEEVY